MSAHDSSPAIAADVWPPILAIDPGGTDTGICIRTGHGPASALLAITVRRDTTGLEQDDDPTAMARYAHRVIAVSRALVTAAHARIAAAAHARGVAVPVVRIAVEGLTEPVPEQHRGGRPGRAGGQKVAVKIAGDTARAAAVFGAIISAFPEVLMAPPRGHDLFTLETYPPTLSGSVPSGWPRGSKVRSHQRSAWMLAGWAHLGAATIRPTTESLPVPPHADDLDALTEQMRRGIRARAAANDRRGTLGAAAGPAPFPDLKSWGDAMAAAWARYLDGPPVPTDREPTAEDAARIVRAAELALTQVGPPPPEPGAPTDVADIAERLLGRYGITNGWDADTHHAPVTASWQQWLRQCLATI